MSLRPSLVSNYEDFYSGDPAIIPLPDEADKEGRAERARLIKQARETGDWSKIIVEGQKPCRFVMKPLSGDAYRELLDAHDTGKIGAGKFGQIAFRMGIVKIVDPELEIAIERISTERYGSIAKVDVTNKLDDIDKGIVSEIGIEAVRRASDLSPK